MNLRFHSWYTSKGFDEYIIICIYSYSLKQNSFPALKILELLPVMS